MMISFGSFSTRYNDDDTRYNDGDDDDDASRKEPVSRASEKGPTKKKTNINSGKPSKA